MVLLEKVEKAEQVLLEFFQEEEQDFMVELLLGLELEAAQDI